MEDLYRQLERLLFTLLGIFLSCLAGIFLGMEPAAKSTLEVKRAEERRAERRDLDALRYCSRQQKQHIWCRPAQGDTPRGTWVCGWCPARGIDVVVAGEPGALAKVQIAEDWR